MYDLENSTERPEEWRVVSRDARYEVSSLGRVRSWAVPGHSLNRRGCPLYVALVPGSSGVLSVHLGARRAGKVHLLVLEAFVGPRPPGMEACHCDGNRANNRLDNLRWDTKQSNYSDRRRHGTAGRLRIEDVAAIRQSNATNSSLAAQYGVARSTIANARSGKTWVRDVPVAGRGNQRAAYLAARVAEPACKSGHPRDTHTILRSNGDRRCTQCAREYAIRYKHGRANSKRGVSSNG